MHDFLHRVESIRRSRRRRGEALRVAVKDVHALLPLSGQGQRVLLIRRRHVVRDARVVPTGEVRRGLIGRRGRERGQRGRGCPVRAGSLDARWGVRCQRHATGGGLHAHRGRQAAVGSPGRGRAAASAGAAAGPLRRATGIDGGHVPRPWRRGPPQRVLDRVKVVLDEIVRDRR